jgi:hypothetical protein
MLFSLGHSILSLATLSLLTSSVAGEVLERLRTTPEGKLAINAYPDDIFD